MPEFLHVYMDVFVHNSGRKLVNMLVVCFPLKVFF